MKSWVIEAIEKEADRRASAKILGGMASGDGFKVAGLTVKQILWMKADWMRLTGREIEDIPVD